VTEPAEPAAGVPLRPCRLLLAATFGRGAIVPVVLLDRLPRWQRPTPYWALPRPHRGPGPGERLAVRSVGADATHPATLRLLADAAGRWAADPPTLGRLPALVAGLPPGLRVTTLPEPWQTWPY
jgi:hypothetical protein